ncbi:MAG TPA: nucleotide exchange factor GrpE [Terriglobales bacterium]|nr:nucleotide exchange factor GrpE [Terriglobales bacterium]
MTMDRNGESRLDLEHELPASEDAGSENGAPDIQAAQAESEVAKLTQERNALYDRLARLQAEFDNFRKRQSKENQDFRDYALTNAIQALLPILDSLDRALQTQPEGQEFRKGVELIDRQFHDALSKLGVEPLEAKGQPFDPNFHQAIQMVESADVPENHVVDELQRGYKIKDRLLRPAMVTVAKSSR